MKYASASFKVEPQVEPAIDWDKLMTKQMCIDQILKEARIEK